MADKICKIYPGNNRVTYIPGILPNKGRIYLPARAKLNEGELRKCLSYATVYEEVNGKDVLLTLQNFNKDNTDGVAETVPEVELTDYVEKESTPVTPESTPQPAKQSAKKSAPKPSSTAPADSEDK